jgi:uncharacterized protein (DUF362 family)
MLMKTNTSRRSFLRTSVLGLAALGLPRWNLGAMTVKPVMVGDSTAVALTTGGQRADLAFRALVPFGERIRRAIGKKRVIIKPNNVSIEQPLCATHAETLEGILEFLKAINKLDDAIIAESAASGPTLDGFANYNYTGLAARYAVKLVDLDQEQFEAVQVFDERDFRPHPVRMSSPLLDPNSYVISAARMKTHDRVVATLSLKNIVLGAPIKDLGFRWGRDSKAGTKNDKPIVHGSGFRGLNYNLFALAQRMAPDLAVIDGFEGMEGNGPVGGTPVDHRVCVVSPDWLAADRVAIELMGIDYARVGYLNYCGRAGLGQDDLAKIELVGESIAPHVKPYRLHDNIDKQLVWMQPAA